MSEEKSHMNEEKLQMFRNRLLKMFRHTAKLAKRQGITCYRIYDHDLPEFPVPAAVGGSRDLVPGSGGRGRGGRGRDGGCRTGVGD